MEEKKLTEKDIENISGGNSEEVWSWCRCFRPSCHYEDKEYGYIPKDEVRLCPACHHDSFKSIGKYDPV